MNKELIQIEEKIKDIYYTRLVDVKADLQTLKLTFLKNAPDSQDKEKIFAKAYDQILVKAADYITRHVEDALQAQGRLV